MKQYLIIIVLLFSLKAFSQNTDRSVCILDLTLRNTETNISYLHSADHMLKVWGVPYTVHTSLDSAFKYGMIVASSRVSSNTFTMDELNILKKYVTAGGVLIIGGYTGGGSDLVKADSLNRFFGVSKTEAQNKLFRLTFTKNSNDISLRWIDDPFEQTISLGNDSVTFTTRSYVLKTAQSLATYENGSHAIISNQYGKGTVYTSGVGFRDLISLSQMDIDYHAERTYSNGFEPGADAFMLFFKAIYTKHFPFSVWKHTIPDKKKGSLIVTHDMDSQTSMDLVTQYSTFEYRKNIIATFNITARYFSDWQMGPFFLPPANTYKLDSARIYCNHVLGNHSIGHFPDMDDEKVFVVGKRGQYTMENYRPRYDGERTTGGIIYAEIELSKQILENRFPVKIRTWRSGNLTYPKIMNNLLDTIGYDFSSSNSANDVLTNFPYKARTDKVSDGTYTRVLEIPMTISDVFYKAGTLDKPRGDSIAEEDLEAKVALWKNVTQKCINNYSPTVLLIHPNRRFKLRAMKRLLEELPMADLDLQGMENFGDFWNYRETVKYTSVYQNDTLKIVIPSEQLPVKRKLGFVIDQGQALDSTKILIIDQQGNPVKHYRYDWFENGTFVMFEPANIWVDGDTITEPRAGFNIFNLYPNPCTDVLKIEYSADNNMDLNIKLYSVIGSLIFEKTVPVIYGKSIIELPDFTGLGSDMYFLSITSPDQKFTFKVIKE